MLFRVVAPVLLGLVLAPLQARAAPSARDERAAKELFARGTTQYRASRFAEALALFRQSFARVHRPNVLFNVARCEEQLGDLEQAYADYARFAEIAEANNPRLGEARRKLDELRPKVPVVVRVRTDPPGAEITTGGAPRILARAPAELRLPAGRHRLRFSLEHHVAQERALELPVGSSAVLDVKLEPLVQVEIVTEPAGAQIRLAGAGQEPAQGRYAVELPPGAYRFSITAPGRVQAEREYVLRPGQPLSDKVVLAELPRTSELLVECDLPGATVFVDAMPVGSTPAARRTLAPGKHQVAVEKEGLRAWRGSVDVVAGQLARVRVHLSSESRGPRVMTWAIGGFGVASLGAGAVFGVLALRAKSDYEARPTFDSKQAVDRDRVLGDVLLGTGAIALVGAYLYHRSVSDTPESSASVSVAAR